MAGKAQEFELFINTSQALKPEDGKEIARQKSLLQTAFTGAEYRGNPKHASILAELQLKVQRVCDDLDSLDDFLEFQKSVASTDDYAFLGVAHPGLNKTGWGILLIEINPLKYGRDLKRVATNKEY